MTTSQNHYFISPNCDFISLVALYVAQSVFLSSHNSLFFFFTLMRSCGHRLPYNPLQYEHGLQKLFSLILYDQTKILTSYCNQHAAGKNTVVSCNQKGSCCIPPKLVFPILKSNLEKWRQSKK